MVASIKDRGAVCVEALSLPHKAGLPKFSRIGEAGVFSGNSEQGSELQVVFLCLVERAGAGEQHVLESGGGWMLGKRDSFGAPDVDKLVRKTFCWLLDLGKGVVIIPDHSFLEYLELRFNGRCEIFLNEFPQGMTIV